MEGNIMKIVWENAWADIICSCGKKIRIYYYFNNICPDCGLKYVLDVKFKYRRIKQQKPGGIS